jgi:hypothetical protein
MGGQSLRAVLNLTVVLLRYFDNIIVNNNSSFIFVYGR